MTAVRKRQLYLQRKEAHLCVKCGRKAIPTRTRCIKHNWNDSQRQKRYYQDHWQEILLKQREKRSQWELEGKCNRCGTPLIEGEGKLCVNCIDATHHQSIGGVFYETKYIKGGTHK